MTIPAEYGGRGASYLEAVLLIEEMAKACSSTGRICVESNMGALGAIMKYGSEAQKREHLPRIVRGEIRWCQGYSEPDAGSDLASLQTRAVREGDLFVVNGTKVWTSYGDQSDWIFALVRTDPQAKKQAGITFLLIDMATPGVSVRPIQLISGKSPFCETRFENVRVPVANALGEINGGWTVAKALLGHERNMIADVFGTMGGGEKAKHASPLAALAREHLGRAPGGALPDPVLRDRIAQSEMDTRVFQLTVQRSRDAARAGHQPGAESSIFKVYATELNQRRTELMVEIAGPHGLGWEGPGFDPEALVRTRNWLRARGNSIEGGTSEVQLNIIAKRVLGLPEA
jgi:alkylation response protein AidB-like acyl-CoA dehydrogenase